MTLKKFSAGALAMIAGISSSIAMSAPAQATSRYGCDYPRACFYKTNEDFQARVVTASYQDVTSGWQILGSGGRDSMWFYNSRNDDVVYLYYLDQGTPRTKCVTPSTLSVFPNTQTVTKIKISSSATC